MAANVARSKGLSWAPSTAKVSSLHVHVFHMLCSSLQVTTSTSPAEASLRWAQVLAVGFLALLEVLLAEPAREA